MHAQLLHLARQLWHDEDGGIVTTEYLTLGTILVLGGVGGLAAMSDAMNSEMAEFGKAVGSVSQGYSLPQSHNKVASRQGSTALDEPCVGPNCCP